MDSWDGYRASRARIQQGWVDRGTRNPVVLTGDVHRAWASDLKADYNNANSAIIGSELVTEVGHLRAATATARRRSPMSGRTRG